LFILYYLYVNKTNVAQYMPMMIFPNVHIYQHTYVDKIFLLHYHSISLSKT